MTQNLEVFSQPLATQALCHAARQERRPLLNAFWLLLAALLLVTLFTVQPTSAASLLGAGLITFTALLPSYLWCSGRTLGLPIFPVFALTCLWTYALPLITNNPQVVTYPADSHFFASLTVAGFLGLGTLIWFQFVKSAPQPPKSYRAFEAETGRKFWLLGLSVSTLFTLAEVGGWFNDMSWLLRIGAGVLSAFGLAYLWTYLWSSERLSKLATPAFAIGQWQVSWRGLIFALICFSIGAVGGWSSDLGGFTLSGGLFTLARSITLGVGILSTFVLAYLWGCRRLSPIESRTFLILLLTYGVASASSLLLISSLTLFLLATIGFVVGRQRIPWRVLIIAFVCFSLLHSGKVEMREKYWNPVTLSQHFVQPWEYPAWYSEWLDYSFNYLINANNQQAEAGQSLTERASLIHLLLLAQEKTPSEVPHLGGITYTIIPQLLVPRILNPDKIRSHEGTYFLNIYYGKQNYAATTTTTIGWGLLNEAYVNFGLPGCAGLAVILGSVYGLIARWSLYASPLSSRYLFAVLFIHLAFQSEFSAGVYIATLYQSTIVLILITFLFMKVYQIQHSRLSSA